MKEETAVRLIGANFCECPECGRVGIVYYFSVGEGEREVKLCAECLIHENLLVGQPAA
jgi:hypothetical protein